MSDVKKSAFIRNLKILFPRNRKSEYQTPSEAYPIIREFLRNIFDLVQWFIIIAAIDYVRIVSHSKILMVTFYSLTMIWWAAAVMLLLIPVEFLVWLFIGNLRESWRARLVMSTATMLISIVLAYGVFFRMINIMAAFEHAQFSSLPSH